MIWACLLVLAGGFAAQHSRLTLSSDISALLLVASLALLSRRRCRKPGFWLLGLSWFLLAGQQIVDHRLQSLFSGDSLLTEVRIIEFPRKVGDSVLMVVEPLDDARLPQRSRVSWFEPPAELSLGEVWQLELRLRRPRGLSNPGVFDREAWLFRNKIHATGYVVGGKRNRRIAADRVTAIDEFRRRFIARAAEASTAPQTAAVLAAIGVGARHGISTDQWQRYAISGTSHLMAISGLHIGLAASAAFLFGRALAGFLSQRANAQLVAILASVVFASAYALVSGLGVPAQRAVIMLLVVAIALLRRRNCRPTATIALAALVVFLANPVATMSAGFHLSFSAVLLLFWLARRQARSIGSRGLFAKFTHGVHLLISMQLHLLFGLMPLTVLLFQRVAVLSLPANLVAVPLFSIVTVPFTLLGLALGGFLDSFGTGALRIAAFSIEILENLIARLVTLPFADINIAGTHGVGWLLVVVPSLLALLPRGWPGRYVAILGVALLILQPPSRPAPGCLDAHVLDVGQGLATVVRTESRTLVFDTGASFRGGGSVAEQVVVPFLKSRGIGQIDWLVVSHADIDHSGGVAALLNFADISTLLAGEPLPATGFPAIACHSGQGWEVDGVRFRVLHPPERSPRDGNNSSCVLLVETGQHSVLLTGDIEAEAERQVVENFTFGQVDAVVIPHHGSLTSSSTAFVTAVSPEIAVVSAGFDNRWGFPKAAVSARWTGAGAHVLNTATSGAVSFRLCRDGGISGLRMDRHERRRFWREDID